MWLPSPTMSKVPQQKSSQPSRWQACVRSWGLVCRQKFLAALYTVLIFCSATTVGATLQELPNLGDSTSAAISPEQEFLIGRAWLRVLRSQAPIITDPLLNDYVTNLTYHLVSFSELNERKLEIVIINDSAINAFVLPGGILSINAGILLHSESEDEMSAVIAHEIAHLSQRHFARNLEKEKRDQWKTKAALLASLALMVSSNNAETGLAALLTTQAATLQSRLSFSRTFEREADRIGMTTLARAQKDPSAMPRFFERLHRATQSYSKAPPEFLLTHPVTESRISDSYNRVIQLPQITPKASLDFSLMKARLEASFSPDKLKNVKTFQLKAQSATTPIEKAAAQFGLARSLLKANDTTAALKILKPLRDKDPNRIAYVIAEAEIYMAQSQYEKARDLLAAQLTIIPDSYALGIYYAQTLLRTHSPDTAATKLRTLLREHPNDPQLWRLLSEAYGATGNIIGVHEARAEVFFLHNRSDQALQQLRFALDLTKENFPRSAKIKQRMQEIQAHKSDLRV